MVSMNSNVSRPSFRLTWPVLVVAVGLLSACQSRMDKAPVEERVAPSVRPSRPVPPPAAASAPVAEPVKNLGQENAGKPGYFTVRPGDTLIRIGLESGQSWRDIVRWNGIENPNLIEVGQVLRVAPPVQDSSLGPKPVIGGKVDVKALDSKVPERSDKAASPPEKAGSAASAERIDKPVADPSKSLGDKERLVDSDRFAWPVKGPILASFDESALMKGIQIGGKAGTPVVAAADGKVVYVGAALRGYGNVVIIQHAGGYLTAYGHNQVILVKDEQAVKRGQKIAEMGSSDADRVKLHFELRKGGTPQDPLKYLPAK